MWCDRCGSVLSGFDTCWGWQQASVTCHFLKTTLLITNPSIHLATDSNNNNIAYPNMRLPSIGLFGLLLVCAVVLVSVADAQTFQFENPTFFALPGTSPDLLSAGMSGCERGCACALRKCRSRGPMVVCVLFIKLLFSCVVCVVGDVLIVVGSLALLL